jgi:signal transduction histidine kinase
LGLVNMHERAELVGGKLSIASAEGQGARITLAVPLQRR